MLEYDKMLCDRIFFSLKGLSDSAIGNILNIKRQTVQGWRSGKSRPTLMHLHNISEFTNISIRWFTSGKTTDSHSVSYVFYPLHNNADIIVDYKAYRAAREISSSLLMSNNDRLFLPILSVLNDIAFKTGPQNRYYNVLDKLDKLGNNSSHPPKPRRVSSQTRSIYKQMKECFIRQQVKYSIDYADCIANDLDYPLTAHTNLEDNSLLKKICLDPRIVVSNNNHIRIIGECISPAVRDSQIVSVSEPINACFISQNTPILSVVELKKNYNTPNNYRLNNRVLLCRYAFNNGSNLILTGLQQNSLPYIISHEDICSVFPVQSVHLN